MLLILTLACAHRPTETVGSEPATCDEAFERGATLYNRGADDTALAIWVDGYNRCGPGYGFLATQAVVASKREAYDDAARLVMRELREARPSTRALQLLIALKLKVSPGVMTEVLAMGRTAEAPVFVPDISGEYAWIRFLVCGGKEEALRQSLVDGLDRMEFVCAGSAPQTVFFKLSAEPSAPL